LQKGHWTAFSGSIALFLNQLGCVVGIGRVISIEVCIPGCGDGISQQSANRLGRCERGVFEIHFLQKPRYGCGQKLITRLKFGQNPVKDPVTLSHQVLVRGVIFTHLL
jgi:hypothetical protein